ncbi:hypothetical protein PsorP6_001668 [Peronosclerospora sorghi]|uniref:Uncharacterized protein n=1 Tax=Peronosclerospora sorghi TaxID=230839 RepID=A0ACC0WX11_9STRA|nr:hypothetical protein PsorP6_001668 [Peronosclerospora sorghi]
MLDVVSKKKPDKFSPLAHLITAACAEQASDAPLKDVKPPLNLADFVKVTGVVKDAVSTGPTRAD